MTSMLQCLAVVFSLILPSCTPAPQTVTHSTPPLRLLIDQRPATLNPRATLDAYGQRINALVFRALTRIDSNLEPRPDLATRWQPEQQGRRWRFWIPKGLQDREGAAITPELLGACLEEYRAGSPKAPIAGAFTSWVSTRVERDTLVLELKQPDPYFPRNVTLLRYFRVPGAARPCTEPANSDAARLIASGPYTWSATTLEPDVSLDLISHDPKRLGLHLEFVQDDNAKVLKVLRGQVDAILNGISLTKTRWLERESARDFRLLERNGTSVSYLAFNLRDPLLSQVAVRRAIALSLDRGSMIEHKMMGFGSPAGSLLSSLLPESFPVQMAFDPKAAETLLDQAGFPRQGTSGTRLTLNYKTTSVREGWETALMIQHMLSRVGIALKLEVVEPATFFASIRKGRFQLFSSRWVGVADASILQRSLQSAHPTNRVGYSDSEVDAWLLKATQEPNEERRRPWLRLIQERMMRDLPYFPLWTWNNALLIRRGWLDSLQASDLSLSGGLEPLTHLR